MKISSIEYFSNFFPSSRFLRRPSNKGTIVCVAATEWFTSNLIIYNSLVFKMLEEIFRYKKKTEIKWKRWTGNEIRAREFRRAMSGLRSTIMMPNSITDFLLRSIYFSRAIVVNRKLADLPRTSALDKIKIKHTQKKTGKNDT